MYIDSGLHILKTKDNDAIIKYLKMKYTQTVWDDYDNNISHTVYFYIETDDEVIFPRFSLDNKNIENKSYIGEDIEIKSNIVLRTDAENKDIQKSSVQFIINNDCCIVKCIPGFGKTVVAIEAISRVKKKTLIIVDQLSLIEQWKDRFKQHSNISEEDMTILTDKFDMNYKIIFTTIQFLLSKIKRFKNINQIMKDSKIGFIIFDEVHSLIGPEKFTTVCNICYAQRLVGLSATPFKNSQQELVITSWLSQNQFVYDKYQLLPKIQKISFKNRIPDKTMIYIYWNESFHKNRYYKSLMKHTEYIKFVSSIIFKLYNRNRHILCLTYLNQMIEEIKNCLIENYNVDEKDVGFFISGKSKDELKHKIVLSNYQMCYKGMDEPKLDTLIFLSYMISPTYLEQSIGRILRIHKNKQEPLVIDFVDERIPESVAAWEQRKKFYMLKKFMLKE